MFDIGQTDPIEGTEVVDDLPAQVEGDDVAGLATNVTDWLTGRGRSASCQGAHEMLSCASAICAYET